jgi:glycosyltransferase involved in cell wall biosynthesis
MASIQNLTKDHIYFNKWYMPNVMNTLKETVNANTFDIIFAYSIEMSLYLSNIGIPTLVDLVDAHFDEEYKLYKLESNLMNKQLHWFMYYLLKKWTKGLPNHGHNNLLVTTSREAEVLLKIIPSCRLTAVNSGVDTDYFSPGETAEEFPSIVFVGTMGSSNNTMAVCHFYNNIYPYIRKELTNIKFYIVGRCPPHSIISIASSDKSVIVTGAVPDVRPYLDRASVVISPMVSGTGIKIKVLEAMAMCKPVICTPESIYGINVKPYENIIIAEANKDFADEIIRLLKNAQLRHLIGAKARETIVQQYSWAKEVEILNECLKKSAGESRVDYAL